jgi:hypothetical protein
LNLKEKPPAGCAEAWGITENKSGEGRLAVEAVLAIQVAVVTIAMVMQIAKSSQRAVTHPVAAAKMWMDFHCCVMGGLGGFPERVGFDEGGSDALATTGTNIQGIAAQVAAFKCRGLGHSSADIANPRAGRMFADDADYTEIGIVLLHGFSNNSARPADAERFGITITVQLRRNAHARLALTECFD